MWLGCRVAKSFASLWIHEPLCVLPCPKWKDSNGSDPFVGDLRRNSAHLFENGNTVSFRAVPEAVNYLGSMDNEAAAGKS